MAQKYFQGQSPNQLITSEVQHKESIKRMSNGRCVDLHFKRYMKIQKATIMTLVANVIMTYGYYEDDFGKSEAQTAILSNIFLFSLLITLIFTIIRHISYNEWKKSQLRENQMLSTTFLGFQIFLVLIQPYPFLNTITIVMTNYSQQYDAAYKLNYLLVLLSTFKCIIIVQFFFTYSKYQTPRSIRLCKMYGSSPSFIYTIKCMFKEKPIILVTYWFVFSIILFSFAFRVAERGISNPSEFNLFDHYVNTFWLTIITMSTVGYGDITPSTNLGRLVGVLCVFWGGFTVSVMVVVLTNTFNLDQRQKRSLVILKRLQIKKQMKIIAGEYIRESLWRLWRNYKDRKNYFEEKIYQRNLKRQFSKMRRYSQTNLMDVDLYEDMTRHFQRINANIQNLKNNAQNLLEYVNQQYFSKALKS